MKPSERFDSLIRYYAERVSLPYDLIRKQVEVESAFNPKAESPAGAKGLLQLMPLTAREVGVSDPSNPDDCLRGGSEYLARQVANVKVSLPHSPVAPDELILRLALVAYNAGWGYVKATIKALLAADTPLTWANFSAAFKETTFQGKRPRWQEALAYAEKIVEMV